jgi:phosphatidylglycerophosphate synthase/diacylglycerol kinase family enzyme
MKLHHSGTKPDWEAVTLDERNRWQTVAASTNGLVTPGNVVSLLGASLSLAGISQAVSGNYSPALGLLIVGRSLDALDGAIADMTGTKSPVGKFVDAGLDKLVIVVAMVGLASVGLLPAWLALSILTLNALTVLAAYKARRRQIVLQPSAIGKIAMMAYWAATVVYIIGNLSILTPHRALHTGLLTAALIVAITTLALGINATVGYLAIAFTADNPIPLEQIFDRYVFIRNPNSTEAHRTNVRLKELRSAQPQADIIILETHPGGRDNNQHLLEHLQGKLGPRTLLCVAAGDGTVNLMLNILMYGSHLSAEARKTPLLPLWCGNANDLAHMLNGHASRMTMKRLLRDSTVVSIHPISCTLTPAGKAPVTHVAACYASFGASAYATEELERTVRKSPMRRFGGTRFGQEVIAVFRALIEVPTFTISQGSQTKVIFERTYLNGSRFAKVIGSPLLLTDKAFHMAMIEHKHFVAVLLHVLGLAEGREGARITMVYDQFTLKEKVWAQFDGEAIQVPSDTEVEMSVSDEAFYALSTRLL